MFSPWNAWKEEKEGLRPWLLFVCLGKTPLFGLTEGVSSIWSIWLEARYGGGENVAVDCPCLCLCWMDSHVFGSLAAGPNKKLLLGSHFFAGFCCSCHVFHHRRAIRMPRSRKEKEKPCIAYIYAQCMACLEGSIWSLFENPFFGKIWQMWGERGERKKEKNWNECPLCPQIAFFKEPCVCRFSIARHGKECQSVREREK